MLYCTMNEFNSTFDASAPKKHPIHVVDIAKSNSLQGKELFFASSQYFLTFLMSLALKLIIKSLTYSSGCLIGYIKVVVAFPERVESLMVTFATVQFVVVSKGSKLVAKIIPPFLKTTYL
mgnify:CR=1 FL=1